MKKLDLKKKNNKEESKNKEFENEDSEEENYEGEDSEEEDSEEDLEEESNDNDSDNSEIEYLYPKVGSKNFIKRITLKKEFLDTKLDGKKYDIEKYSNEICNRKFELASHQLFVKNFMSINTPYNTLLLYHGLGTGKTF